VYVPHRYAVSDDDAWALVDEVGAGFLVVSTSEGMQTVFAPVLVSDDRSTVLAHVSRANPWWTRARDGDEVLGLFRAADSYVSPSLYPGKTTDPRVAPTWDYDIVEVRGRVGIHDDAAFVEGVVRGLSERNERSRSEQWSVDDAPPEFVAALVTAIVGLSIAVTSITGAAKLSQNQSELDRQSVRNTFAAGSDRERAVAARMKKAP